MKTSPEDVTVLLVGGGSIIAPAQLEGVGEIIRPLYFGVANAVGAAMAKGKSCDRFETWLLFFPFMQLRERSIPLRYCKAAPYTMSSS